MPGKPLVFTHIRHLNCLFGGTGADQEPVSMSASRAHVERGARDAVMTSYVRESATANVYEAEGPAQRSNLLDVLVRFSSSVAARDKTLRFVQYGGRGIGGCLDWLIRTKPRFVRRVNQSLPCPKTSIPRPHANLSSPSPPFNLYVQICGPMP